MCAIVADVHRLPWSADCWALNFIPIIFAVLLAWHCAPILPPKSAQVERINLGRPRPRFNPAQCSSQGTISYIMQIMSSFWAGSSFSHSDWSPAPQSQQTLNSGTWKNLTGQVWVCLGSSEIGTRANTAHTKLLDARFGLEVQPREVTRG